MDGRRFDAAVRRIADSRRSFLGGALAATAGFLGFSEIDAKKKRKKKKKKAKKNEFGCVDVGRFCKNSGQCCSGICKGKKGKKKCKAHDQSTCAAGQVEDFCGGTDVPCLASGVFDGFCNTTTGKAGYCTVDGECFPCSKDADCTALCGPQAACIVCTGCDETEGLACVGPAPGSCGGIMP